MKRKAKATPEYPTERTILCSCINFVEAHGMAEERTIHALEVEEACR